MPMGMKSRSVRYCGSLRKSSRIRSSSGARSTLSAKLDTLLIGEVAEKLTPEERETAIDEVIELGGAIDGLLAQQIGLNIEALEKVTGRMFTAAEKEEITTKTQRAWRWTFLVSGLEHPNVVKTVGELTTAGPGKIKGVAEALSA